MNRMPLDRRSMIRLGAASGPIAGAIGTLPMTLPAGCAVGVSALADLASPTLYLPERNPLDTSHAGHSLSALLVAA